MKVCYITHLSNLSGSNQSLLDILHRIRKFDVEPVVLLRKHGPIENELNDLKISYTIISYATIIKSRNSIKNFLKLFLNKMISPEVKNYLTEQKIDIVHNNSFACGIGMDTAFHCNIPYICHNREIVGENCHIQIMQQEQQFFLMKNAAAVIEISEFIYNYYKKFVPDANFRILRDGINTEKYFMQHEKILCGNKIEILYAGIINSQKGQMQAVQAMEMLQSKGFENFHLNIVGSGIKSDYGKLLLEYIRSHNIRNISFMDFSDLRELRKNSDIVLICSKNEGLGRVTIEGQLSGCLVIGADSGATKEIIADGETGLLYEYGNIEDLVDKLISAVSNPERMNRIALAGQKSAKQNFDIDKYNSELFKIYKQILDEKQKMQ